MTGYPLWRDKKWPLALLGVILIAEALFAGWMAARAVCVALDLQAAGLATATQPIAADPGVQRALRAKAFEREKAAKAGDLNSVKTRMADLEVQFDRLKSAMQ